MRNASTSPDDTDNMTVTDTRIIIDDPNVFSFSATGTGRAGTACAGETFTITQITPTQWNIIPLNPPITLGPPTPGDNSDICIIDAEFDVLYRPTDGDSRIGLLATGTIGTDSDTSLGSQLITITAAPVICYLAGTKILTPKGEIPIEQLQIKQLVRALSKEKLMNKRIQWIGHFTPKYRSIYTIPIKICKSALADNLPNSDLWISPNHAIYINGIFVQAKNLVNGKTIYQDNSITDIKYYHIELSYHTAIVANGLYAETYLNSGSKHRFDNCKNQKIPAIDDWRHKRYAPIITKKNKLKSLKHQINNRISTLLRV